jgi:hypothetical protein
MADQDAQAFLDQFGASVDPKALAQAYFAPKPMGPGIPIVPPQPPPQQAAPQLPIGLPPGMTLGLPPGSPPMAHGAPPAIPGMGPDPTRAATADLGPAGPATPRHEFLDYLAARLQGSTLPSDNLPYAQGGALQVPDVTIHGGRTVPMTPQDYARAATSPGGGGGGGAGPGPSGWVGKERMVEQGPDLTPELADVAKAQETVGKGIEEQREAIEKGTEERKRFELSEIGREADEAKRKVTEAQRMSAAGELDLPHQIRAKSAEIDKAIDDVRTGKVDPGRYVKNQNFFAKIASIAGLAVGGIFQGISAYRGVKVENPAMKMLDDAIDRDIEAQKADLASKREVAGAKQTERDRLMAQFKDANEREVAARLMAREAAQDHLKTIAQTQQDAQSRGALTALMGENQLKLAQERAKLSSMMQGSTREEQINADLLPRGGGGGGRYDEKWVEHAADELSKDSAAEEAYGHAISALSSPLARHALGPVADKMYNESPYLYAEVYGEDAAQVQQASRLAMHQYTHELGGARGFSPTEIAQFQATIDAQHTPEGKIAALKMVRQQLGSRRKQIESGGTDAARRELERREQREGVGQPTPPAGATTPGSFR